MNNFNYSAPVDIFFGEGGIKRVGRVARNISQKVLLVYGKESIKKNGIYDEVIGSLTDCGCSVVELSHVLPNPDISKVREGIAIAREAKVGLIVPVGGGSVWDLSKAVAAGFFYDGDPWEMFTGSNVVKALPIAGVITVPASSSETNRIAVISNSETREKKSLHSPAILPKATIVDPLVGRFLSKEILAHGILDIVSHLLEGYFDRAEAIVQDVLVLGLVKFLILHSDKIIENKDARLREEFFYSAIIAHSGQFYCGRAGGDWACHKIEHAISAYKTYIVHAQGLALVMPAWMRLVYKNLPQKFSAFFEEVFGESDIEQGINAFENWIISMGIRTRLSQYPSINSVDICEFVKQNIKKYKAVGQVKVCDDSDIEKIFKNMS